LQFFAEEAAKGLVEFIPIAKRIGIPQIKLGFLKSRLQIDYTLLFLSRLHPFFKSEGVILFVP